jgi:glyoxylase-like metal-dependent hydrolase (beta-lactamase superfamily II)
MAEIFILVEGYVKDDGQTVQGTATLVQDNGHNILVDPGMTRDPLAITKALQAHGLQPDDIDTVFITHHHPDHTRYMGLFVGARVYDYASLYASDRWLNIDDGHAITPNVKIKRTPGHTNEDATLIVSNVTNISEKNSCTIAICHLWWYEGKDDDPTAINIEQLCESRKKITAMVDFIVPGHGKMFTAG